MSYLFRRHGIFYFRFAIPAQLREMYGSKTEIRKSLKTFDKTTAQTLALYIAAYLKTHMSVKRKTLANKGDFLLKSSSKIEEVPAEKTCPLIEIRLVDDVPVVIINHDDPADELHAAAELLRNLQPKINNHPAVVNPSPRHHRQPLLVSP